MGKFVSYSPSGISSDDIRFQDVWLRTFQERADADGRFHMRMIRRADQAAKSWPRGGDIFAFKCLCMSDISNWGHTAAHSMPVSAQCTRTVCMHCVVRGMTAAHVQPNMTHFDLV